MLPAYYVMRDRVGDVVWICQKRVRRLRLDLSKKHFGGDTVNSLLTKLRREIVGCTLDFRSKRDRVVIHSVSTGR